MGVVRLQEGIPSPSPSSLSLSSSPAVSTETPKSNQRDESPLKEEKPKKKKICCACPNTKKLRDECIVEHGEDACSKWIEAHRMCLRSEGFNV